MCGDDWRRVHASGYRTGDEYIRVPRGQETTTYNRRRVHTIGDEYIRVKSVQSALSNLLTTYATHGTCSRLSTKRGLILIGLELNTNARESLNIADHVH